MTKFNSLLKYAAILLFAFISFSGYAQNLNMRKYSGQLINPADNKPITDVVIFSSKTIASAVPDSSGKFTLITPLGSILQTDKAIPGYTPIIITEKNSQVITANDYQNNISKTESPYFKVVSESEKTWLPLKSTIVDVNIAGIIANVSVK